MEQSPYSSWLLGIQLGCLFLERAYLGFYNRLPLLGPLPSRGLEDSLNQASSFRGFPSLPPGGTSEKGALPQGR